MAKQRSGARPDPYGQLNDFLHSLAPGSPRAKMASMMQKQGSNYDPGSSASMRLMRQRNPGRSLQNTLPLSGRNTAMPRGRRGEGMVYIPQNLDSNLKPFGRGMIANHELEHAYGQRKNMPDGRSEIAPVIGDVVFGAEDFRRQENKPLQGSIAIGHKTRPVEWMRQMANQHGYFDGRSMQELLETPAGLSYLKQAATGEAPNPYLGTEKMATNQPPFMNDLRTFFSPPSGSVPSVRPSTGEYINVAKANAERLAEQRRRATQGGTSPLRQGDNSVPMARPGSYPQIQVPNAPRPQQTYSGSAPSTTSAVAPPYRRPLDAMGRPKPLLNMSLSEIGQFITGRPSASSRPATAKPPAAATTPPMQLVAPANAQQQQMQLVAPANARQQMPTLPQPTVQSPSVNVPLPPSVYPDGGSGARIGNAADTLQARMAEGAANQNKIESMTPDEFREEVSSTNRGSGNYFDMTKRGPYGITDVVVRPRSAKENFDSRLANMSPEELKKEAFTSRQSGVRGSGPYGGTATYTQPGGMAGREAALAGSSLDYGAGTGPVEQPPRRPGNTGTVVGYEQAKDLFGPSIEPGSTQVTPNGTRVTVGLDTKDPFRALDGDSVLIGTQGRFGGPRRDGRPKQGPGGEYVPGGDLTTNEKFMAQRNRRRDRAQRAQEIMSLGSQMANTTTGRQAFGMGGNGFSPQMQYATTYQYNRPSPGQAAAMLDASRRRQDVLDRADEQQAFNNQLAVVTAMPEGPERTQALSRLQSQMQPSSGEVEGPASEVDTEIQGYVNSGNVPVAPALNARIIADIPVQERTAIAEQYASVMTSGMSNQAKRQFLEQQGIRTRDDMNDLQRGVPGYSTSGIGQYPLTKLYDEIYGIQTPSASIFDDNYDPSANLGR